MDLSHYRAGEAEQLRVRDLLRLLPGQRRSVLEIGARDGFHSRMLTDRFESVTALDLERPSFSIARVRTVQGDVTSLDFPDNSFDCVLCAEVLEHVLALERAAAEISRVARFEALIGVPYRQDLRVGRLTCARCGRPNPAYGHRHTFDEQKLRRLFCGLQVMEISYVGSTTDRANAVSAWLMDLAGNPWGTYDQDESCLYCGSRMGAPASYTFIQKVSCRLAVGISELQRLFARPSPAWMHVLFHKPERSY